MKNEKFELETDYAIEECKNILQKNMDTTFLIGERYLKFKGDSIKLFATRENLYMRTFKGKFYRNGKKTILTGAFHINQSSTVFIIISFLSLLQLFLLLKK